MDISVPRIHKGKAWDPRGETASSIHLLNFKRFEREMEKKSPAFHKPLELEIHA